jgi:hypothetical protein
MDSVSPKTCQLRRGFFTCTSDAIGLCQYCARLFCREHGIVQEDGQEVCSRRFCVAKRNDLVEHLAYKEAVFARNQASRCGIEGCNQTVAGRCGRCEGYFCARHVGAREETYLQNQVRLRRMASLCHHCWARRPIWIRV